MANDNDKNRPHGSILNREPNKLDKIGSRNDIKSSLLNDVALMERRAAIETVEMRRLQQRIEDIHRIRKENAIRYALAAIGQLVPTEQMFVEAGVRPSLASEFVTELSSSPNQLAKAYTTAVDKYGVRLDAREKRYQSEYSNLKERAQVNAARIFSNKVISVAGSERSMRSALSDPNIMEMAEKYAASYTEDQLRKKYEHSKSARYRSTISLEKKAEDIFQEGGQKDFNIRAKDFAYHSQQEAALYGALRLQERAGLTKEKMKESGELIQSTILERREREELSKRVASGSAGSLSSATSKLTELEDAFIKINKEFKETAQASEDLRKSFNNARNSIEEQQKVVDEIKRQGGGGGGRFGRAMTMVSQIGGPLLDAARYGFVTSDVQQMNVRIGAAQFANQRYTDQLAATQGDMAALRRVTQRQQDAAAAYGRAYGQRETAISAGEIGVGIAGAIAGGTTAAALAAPFGGVTAVPAGIIGAIGGAVYATNKAVSIGKGVTYGQQQQMSANQYQHLMDTVNAIPDAARQRFFDYRMGAYQSMMGAGSAFSGMYAGATSQKALETLAAQGLGPEEGAALFGFGARSIGASFTRASADTRLGMVSRAGQLQALGVMSAQEYMGRIGQMAQTGGSQKDVEDVLANAVARGVDDAKSLSGMFEGIQALSRDAASKGVGVAPIVGAQMMFGMEMLRGSAKDEALKQAQVLSGLSVAERMTTSTGVDFSTMSTMAGLTGILPGVSPQGLGKIAGTSVSVLGAQLQQLRRSGKMPGQVLSPSEIAAMEVPEAFVNKRGELRNYEDVEKIMSEKLVNQIAGRYAYSPEISSAVKKLIEAKGDISKLTTPEQLAISETQAGMTGTAAIVGGAFGTESFSKDKFKEFQPLTGGAKSAQDAMIAGAAGQVGQILDAGRLAGGMDNLAAAISEHMTKTAEMTSAVQSAIESTKAAASMKLDTKGFNDGVRDFKDAVGILVNAVAPIGSGMSDQKFRAKQGL